MRCRVPGPWPTGWTPGIGPWRSRLDRLPAVIDGLVERFRARAAVDFGLPDGEDLRVRLVTGQPWSGYNWYDGGRRSRVDVNTDLPVRVPALVHTVAHETYPGHHLEHAWKEADLVDGQGRLEASILLINTPECPISEGLADLGVRFADPARGPRRPAHRDIRTRRSGRGRRPGGRPDGGGAGHRHRAARHTLDAVRGNAAYRRHADGASHDEVLTYLQDVGGFAPAVAAKRLEFIEHPLWRTYVFVYAEGKALLRSWLEAVPPEAQTARFGRLLHEQVTPGSILAELD